MQWVIPMAGLGTRTLARGPFKPFIPVAGRPIVGWCLTGLAPMMKSGDRLVTVTTEAFDRDFDVCRTLAKIAVEFCDVLEVITLTVPDVPAGPANTVSATFDHLDREAPVFIVNSDQLIQFHLPQSLEADTVYLPVYFNATGKSSYVTFDQDHRVNGIVEKELRSLHASAGVYGFGRADRLMQALQAAGAAGGVHKGELYLSHVASAHISAGGMAQALRTFIKYDLGNVPEIEFFERQGAPLLKG